jgi:hypothetical protein
MFCDELKASLLVTGEDLPERSNDESRDRFMTITRVSQRIHAAEKKARYARKGGSKAWKISSIDSSPGRFPSEVLSESNE